MKLIWKNERTKERKREKELQIERKKKWVSLLIEYDDNWVIRM